MTIATIITRGYGSYGAIGFVVTRGYQGTAAPNKADTHDGADSIKKRRYHTQKELDALNKGIRELEREKLEARNLLREQLERVIYGEPEEVAITLKEIKAANPDIKLKPKDRANIAPILEAKIATLQAEMLLLQEEMRLNTIAERKIRDEEDIRVILMIMNAPFSGFGKTIH